VEPDCGDWAPCLPDEFQFYLKFHRTILTRLSAETVTVSAPNTYISGLCVRSSIPHRHRLRLSSSIFSLDVARSASVRYCCCAQATGCVGPEDARGVGVEVCRGECVCRAAATGLDIRGVLTSRRGTGTRTPRGRKRHEKKPKLERNGPEV
jgi:hypothetical protein